MVFTMTTKRILNCFFIIITCGYSAFAQTVGDKCVVELTGIPGICRIYQDCPEVQEQAQNGIMPTKCGYYQLTEPIVCCQSSLTQPDTLLPPDSFVFPDEKESESSEQQAPVLSISEQKCLEYTKANTDVVQAIPLVPNTEAVSIHIEKCDYNGVALIVGGKPATAGEFPYMAAIGFYVEERVQWRCGGTLISEEYVLTAAHCTYSRDAGPPKIVRLGELDLTSDDDGSVYADYNIGRIIVHPRYRFPPKYFDIALIKLVTVVQFSKFIRPACLYTKPQVEQQQAIATGWGKTDWASAEINDKLLKVSLNVYDNEKCAKTYAGEKKHLPQGITSNMLCAGDIRGGKDTCQGDSGGPLLITKKSNQCKFYLVGITSFGRSCGQENTPAVYTKVSEFVPWIEKTIW